MTGRVVFDRPVVGLRRIITSAVNEGLRDSYADYRRLLLREVARKGGKGTRNKAAAVVGVVAKPTTTSTLLLLFVFSLLLLLAAFAFAFAASASGVSSPDAAGRLLLKQAKEVISSLPSMMNAAKKTRSPSFRRKRFC